MMRRVSTTSAPPHTSQLGTAFCKTLTAQQLIMGKCSGQGSTVSTLLRGLAQSRGATHLHCFSVKPLGCSANLCCSRLLTVVAALLAGRESSDRC